MKDIKEENEEVKVTDIKLTHVGVHKGLMKEVKKESEDQNRDQTASSSFKTEHIFSQDVATQQTQAEKPFTCHRCGRCFRYRGQLSNRAFTLKKPFLYAFSVRSVSKTKKAF